MKDSHIFVVLALLQLSLGLPFESSQQTEVAANSEFDNASLDAAASSQPQLSGQYVDGPQVGGAQAAAGEANPDAGGAQAASGGAQAASGGVQANHSGLILVGAQAQPQVLAVGEAQAFGGGTQAVGGAQVAGGEQVYLSGQTNGGAQGAVGGAKADVEGSLAVAGGTKADAGGAQAAPVGAQAYLSGQAIVGVQAQSQGPVVGGPQAAAAGATRAQAVVGDKAAVGGTPAGDLGPQAVGGQHPGTGGAQTYLSGQANGVLATGNTLAVGGAATAGGGQANGRAQVVQVGAEAPSSQSSTGTASNSMPPSPGLQLPQGSQVSRSESSSGQTSKQSQAQVIGGAMSSNLTINASGASSGVSKGSVGQTNTNKGIQAGFEIIT